MRGPAPPIRHRKVLDISQPPADRPVDRLETVADDVLVARAIDGDTASFGILVRRHTPLLRAYTARIVGSLAEADDIVQETFLTAWQQLPALHDGSSFKAWLMRIGSRRAVRHAQRRPAETALPEHVADPRIGDPETSAIHSALLRAVGSALDKLPADQRRCWLLRELGGLSYEQIAVELDATPAQVRGRLARARASMTVELEGWR